MKRMLAVLALALSVPSLAAANTLTLTQPAGGAYTIGSPMTIAWTKDFAASGAAAAMLIRVQQRSGDLYVDKGQIAEVGVGSSPFTWQSAGTLQGGSLPPGGDYFITLQMKQSPAVAARGSAFSLKRRLIQTAKAPVAFPSTTGIKVYIPNALLHCTPSVCTILWDRTNIEAYDQVHFWIRLPGGAIGSRDKVYGTMSNAKLPPEAFCVSGNCGAYQVPAGIAREPSAGNLYYFELFTMDQKHKGKSETFAWQ